MKGKSRHEIVMKVIKMIVIVIVEMMEEARNDDNECGTMMMDERIVK